MQLMNNTSWETRCKNAFNHKKVSYHFIKHLYDLQGRAYKMILRHEQTWKAQKLFFWQNNSVGSVILWIGEREWGMKTNTAACFMKVSSHHPLVVQTNIYSIENMFQ